MSSYVDLHLHTNCSDGSDSPDRVVERAAAAGLAAIAITDHDTMSGLVEASYRARAENIEFLDGVEISCTYGRMEVHIVGLGVSRTNTTLREALTELRAARDRRIDAILERLKACGVALDREEVAAHASGADALGRVHVARALFAKGITRTIQHGFDKYLRNGRKAYVPKTTFGCTHAIELIHQAGGLAFLAHPGISLGADKLLQRILAMPFDGIEVYHTTHSPGYVTAYTQLALERDLLISGGSDCHGTATRDTPDMGKVRLPYTHFQRIKEALEKR